MTIRDFEGKAPHVGHGAYVDDKAIVIGDVTLGEDASIWPMTVARGDIHTIAIGARTNIQDGSVLHVTHDSEYNQGGNPLVIGSDVTVGHQVILHGCTVENDCLIGMGSVIMDGAVLHPRLILGAGSLVAPGKELDGGYLWIGRPAKRVRPLTEQEFAQLEYSASHYVRLKNRHIAAAASFPR